MKKVIGSFALFVLAQCSDGPPPEPPRPLSAATVAGCEGLLHDAERAGLIRQRPSNNRIDVEDLQWAELPADTKRAILLTVTCSAYHRHLFGTDYAVAYGYRSGKRVGMISLAGSSFD